MAHRALATRKKMTYVGFQCLDYPPYSPDLAPSDYHLFPGLKKIIEREVGRVKDLSALRFGLCTDRFADHESGFKLRQLAFVPIINWAFS
jgi:hypothetical protein